MKIENEISKKQNYIPKGYGAVSSYIERGFSPIPIPYMKKAPVLRNWNSLNIRTEDEIEKFFPDDQLTNIGILLGDASGGIIDVDIDDNDAIHFADHFLPHTGMIFGRASRPATHRIYKVIDPSKPLKFASPNEGCILEIRSNGQQTIFPPSVHQTGEEIIFDDEGDPSWITWQELEYACVRIAIATLLFKNWKSGIRHQLALGISGLLSKAGWSFHDIQDLISIVAIAAGDDELPDRINAIQSTMATLESGNIVAGYTALQGIIDHSVISDIEKWLGIINPKATQHTQESDIDLNTDAGCADAFAKEYLGKLLYSDAKTQWYQKNNRIFEKVSGEEVQGIVMDFLKKMEAEHNFKLNNSLTKTLLGRGRINAVVELSRSRLRADSKAFDTNRSLIGTSDGNLIDLNRAGVASPDISDIVTRKIGIPYSARATCPTWLNFLDTIFDHDEEVIRFLQRAVGYSLSGHVSEQAVFILIGSGANGKSTFLKAIMQLMGEYATTLPMQTLMEQKFGSNQTNDLASLEKIRFVSASEGEANQKLAESKIKLMSGGDPIKCRSLYADFFQYDPQFKIWLATNNLPSVSGSDDAVWRRLKVIRFPVVIPPDQRDRRLSDKLQVELPGILNWALEGYQNWKEIGLKPPKSVELATSSYRGENDDIGNWLKARCIIEPSARSSMKDLHNSYADWCIISGVTPLSNTLLGKELTKRAFQTISNRKGNFRKGIQILPMESEFDQDFGRNNLLEDV